MYQGSATVLFGMNRVLMAKASIVIGLKGNKNPAPYPTCQAGRDGLISTTSDDLGWCN